MARDRNETIHRITVEDIFLASESFCRDEDMLTDEVIEKVVHKIEAMDFGDMAQTIDMFIDEAIRELNEAEAAARQQENE
jgi:hypothetical protein